MASVPTEGRKGKYASTTSTTDALRNPAVEQPETLHLRSLMQAPALIALLRGPEHVYEFVNERYVQLLGDRGFVGRPACEAVPEAVEQGLVEILDRVYASGEPFMATEMPLRFVQGATGTLDEGFYNFVYQPLHDGRGAVTGIMVHAVDVTHEVQNRRRFERLAAEHTATLSQMADGVMIVDTTGHISFQNEAARRLLGVDGVGLSLEAWLETIQVLTLDGVPLPLEETWLARTVQGDEGTLGVERRIRRSDGMEIVVHGSATPVTAEDGSRYGSVFTFRDITEHKQMEEARSALAAIVESSSDAIISATMDGIINGWDRGAEHLYGYHASEAIGRPVSLIVPPDRVDELSIVLAQMRKGESVEHVETVRRHKHGHLIDISVSVSPIRDASGVTTGALSIAHDIGKRKRLERERAEHQEELTTRVLQAQEHERQRIARELHDDTAQSLSSLLINLDLLETQLPDSEPALRVGFDRVRDIARRALDSTRTLAHGLRPTILDDFGLDAALEWIAVDHSRTFGVPVRVAAKELPPGRLGLEGELAIFRIAQEALTNSGRHAGATAVCVTLSSSRRTVKLVVEDNGKGFDVDSLAGASRESGLGLHGIQERVQLLGAVLDVQSAPGKGTRIAVSVPLVSARARSPRQIADTETGRQPC